MTHSHARSGFSLMELMLYMGIVALIMAGLGVTVTTLMYNAKVSKTETNMQLIKSSIDTYHARKDEYPKKLNELTPRHLKTIPKDGWGNAFVYKLTEGSKHPYKLYSHGDKGPGGGGKTLGVWD